MKTYIVQMDLRKLKLLEKNARFMTSDVFHRLVDNIRRDGKLTSVPFAAKAGYFDDKDTPQRDKDGKPVFEVLSGNHRVMAAIEAGVTKSDVMCTDDPIPKGQRIALQLSHNAIEGQDDPAILRELWEDIGDVDWKGYSGLDEETLDMLSKLPTLDPIADVQLDYRTIEFLFLPNEYDKARAIFDEIVKSRASVDEISLVPLVEWDRTLDMLADVGESYGVRNRATILWLLLNFVEAHLTDFAAAWEPESERRDGWVPLSSIFGTRAVPVEAARVIKRAVDKMVSADDVSEKARWQAIEFWAAEYLGR